jgi:hypothetical protein
VAAGGVMLLGDNPVRRGEAAEPQRSGGAHRRRDERGVCCGEPGRMKADTTFPLTRSSAAPAQSAPKALRIKSAWQRRAFGKVRSTRRVERARFNRKVEGRSWRALRQQP